MTHQQAKKMFHDEAEDNWKWTEEAHDLELAPKRRWQIVHHGKYDPEDKARSYWHQDGDITVSEIENSNWPGNYLECRVKDVPFLSIRADIDQWGTYYDIKVKDAGGEMRGGDDVLIYAQEWGNPSFIRTLGHALIALADMSEPGEGEYGKGCMVEMPTDPDAT